MTWQHVQTLSSIPEYFGSLLRMRKGVTALTIRTLGQAVQTRSCFGKNIAILERRSQKTVLKQLSDRSNDTHQSPNLNGIRFSVGL
jgi:hypothetical protein